MKCLVKAEAGIWPRLEKIVAGQLGSCPYKTCVTIIYVERLDDDNPLSVRWRYLGLDEAKVMIEQGYSEPIILTSLCRPETLRADTRFQNLMSQPNIRFLGLQNIGQIGGMVASACPHRNICACPLSA